MGRAADKLPDYEMPPFDGIGANEYIVDVVHDVCDFISAVDTPAVWELNIWYHTLNCGMTTPDQRRDRFPLHLRRPRRPRPDLREARRPPTSDGAAARRFRPLGRSASATAAATAATASSHLIDFTVNGLGVGETGDRRPGQRARRQAGEKLTIKVNAAALPDRRARHLERPDDPQTRGSIKNPTGTSSGPASATRARCRSS